MNSIDTETVAEVLAEIRDAATSADAWRAGMAANVVMGYADRVEIAVRRELDHAVEHATRHAEAVARDNCRDCVHNPSSNNFEGGNAAAMREALDAALAFVSNLEIEPYSPLDEAASELRQRVMDALSAPARNCDRLADELDAQLTFLNEVWLISVDRESMLERDRYENWTDEMRARYGRWLFAPAAEREGDGDAT